MLLRKDLKNKNNSLYRCDACYRTMKTPAKYNIDVNNAYKWHLCSICYKRVCKFIEQNCTC